MSNDTRSIRRSSHPRNGAAMYARQLERWARAVRVNEGLAPAACPDTSDLLTLGGEIRDRDLERRRRELEEPVCSAMRAAFSAPEMAGFVQQIMLHGRAHIARDGEPEMCVISPTLEGRADRLAERLRTSWGLALRRFQADLIAESIDALSERLESRPVDSRKVLFQAACATAEFLRSPGGLQPGRVRANDIASLLEQLAAVSRKPVRQS